MRTGQQVLVGKLNKLLSSSDFKAFTAVVDFVQHSADSPIAVFAPHASEVFETVAKWICTNVGTSKDTRIREAQLQKMCCLVVLVAFSDEASAQLAISLCLQPFRHGLPSF